ncbi:MAG: hypothetical protein CL558_02105 [Alphaproteobacteria bacterium]|nr:hypothetical protein [Alphaproteobacteria bacterium]OUT41153.1 MAG: hypothetical protein CBB62_01970 [Micavibrio sp. TMED2]MAS47340.1 hypothetical protein [Alphaproteobacteria bacterium]MAX96787.1 hypothetical protein [Alphaproteobacteria bacterium]MAX97132.1 hypothetical protein [Alphaproteobacteria bacterium]|tara:strand:- start:9728 stop:10909 length:1182 start_codon:yes stop_codon:yes gene_type:complete
MNFETGYGEVWAARRNPDVRQAAGNMQPAEQQASDDDMSFWDFLDVVNPLQHIPFVNTVYRELTGDTIKPSTQMAGGMLFGGPFAMVGGAFNAMFEQTGGSDMASTMLAALDGDTAVEVETLPPQEGLPQEGSPQETAGSVMLASADRTAETADGHVHHALDNTLGDSGDAMAQQVLVAAADAYASEKSMDSFLMLASGAAATPAVPGVAPMTAPRAPAGTIQMADTPIAEDVAEESEEAEGDSPALQLASLDSEDRPSRRQPRTIAAADANAIPLDMDDVRRYNRTMPLHAGASSHKAEIKAAEVAQAAARLAAAKAEEAKLQQASAGEGDVAANAAPAVATTVNTPKPAAPASVNITDPFGRNISANNLADKMRQALEKYQASNSLYRPGI